MTKSRGIRNPKGTRAAFVAANQGRYSCECGCGQLIEIRTEHFNVGIPRYQLGHNPRRRKQRLPQMPCACGCGALAGPGKRFVSGHNARGVPRSESFKQKMSAKQRGAGNPMYGKVPANFKGRVRHGAGYVLVHSPKHPFAGSKTRKVMEHRLVMEAHLRESDPTSPYLIEIDGVLYLRREFEVHHRNEVKDDNRIENFEVLTTAEHARLHGHIKNYPGGKHRPTT